MKRGILLTGCILIASAGLLQAETIGTADWVGVWHGGLDGQPGVALTLAKDTGELGGTLVLNMVSRDGGLAHVIASEPHVLIHPRVDGNALSFAVKWRSGELMNFVVARSPDGTATIHCLGCGANAPVGEITKAQ